MKDLDLEELADLWQQPDAGGTEDINRMGRRARRDAWLMSWADTALAVFIVGSLLVAGLMKPSIPVAVGALLTIILTLWLNWKRRNLRQIMRTLGTSDRADLLDSSVRLARAGLRRVTLSLLTFPPAILVTVLYRVGSRAGFDHPLVAIALWAGSLKGMVGLALLATLVAWMLRSRRRYKNELRQLEQLRLAYEEEAARDQEVES